MECTFCIYIVVLFLSFIVVLFVYIVVLFLSFIPLKKMMGFCDLDMMGGLGIGICVRNQSLVLISLT